ncbi:peptidase domain-containing ABC transporter [Magnetovibrio blakemorei]|uniref:Type I secretion system ATPase n=1 Tax=Magnetovibrio blakemorei TaxID=28181 RepID=A0A1E5Q631_9PROT|nr:ATP-binding cassette domain-containing protein [Magnetovibrio blakemorei]OEJ65972.1 hypothetical protein BEN30_13320 [Magnetovibrio blakemorei]
MSFFVNLLAMAVPIFTMQVYNRVVGNNGISTLQGLVVGMILVIIFDYILRQSRARILQTVALRVDVDLGRRLFRKVMRVPLQTLEIQPSAYWSSLFRDVDMVRNTLSGSTALLVADLPFALLFLVVIFVIAAPVAWVLLVMLPVFMFVAWRSSNVMSEASSQERKSTQSRDSLVAEMIAGRTTIKALALDRSMEPVWEEAHAENIESAITRGSKTDGFSNIGSSLGLLTSLLLTTVGALAIIDQQLTMGALIATNMLSGRIMGPLNQLVGTWRLYSGFLQATERLGKVFTGPSEREASEIKLKKPRGALSIENVIFSYSPDLAPVVSGITVDIAPGGVHALVGRNGSGKTTLLKLIQGLYQPQKGRVTMDGADIAQFTRSELADWLGYVPQESVLFAGTVRDNIISRMPNATDEEVIQASTEAGVHQFIIDLPDGYATEIGEAGGRLSGGQRQRIAIARALVGNPPVVLLDEPSSSLDRHAETELKNTLVEIAKTRTVIMVSHSPTLLSACDFLYALDRGKLALSGPAREVLPRLFGGKAPPPKGDGPKAPPKGPNGGPGGGKPNTGYEAIMAKAGVKSADASSAAAASASPAPMHTATPQKPAAKLKAPAKLTPIEKAALAQASATQTHAAQAPKTAAAAKPKVKAAAMARGKAPRMAKPKTAANSTGPISSNASQPILRSAEKTANATPGGVQAGAQLRSVTPIHRTVGKPVSAPSSLATPALRGARSIRARANLDLQPTQKSAVSQNSAEHVKAKIKAGAALRPTTKSILNTWAEGGIPAPSTPRKGTTNRGTGARTRSTPTLRLKGPVGE